MATKMEKSAELLLNVYQQLYGPQITMVNLNELAASLSEIAGRHQPWTGKYLHSLLKKYQGFTASVQLRTALNTLLYHTTDVDEVRALATEATILAVHALPTGTVVLGRARRCAAPGCQICFVPTHPCQKYHSKVCAQKKRLLSRHQNGQQPGKIR